MSEDELYRVFRAMDKDNDGSVTLEDLKVYIETFTPMSTQAEIAYKSTSSPRRSGRHRLPAKPSSWAHPGHEVAYRVLCQLYHMHITDSDLFRRADLDGGGDLTQVELVAGLASVGIFLSADDESLLFHSLDPYEEGRLSFQSLKLLYDPIQLAATAGHGAMPPLLKARAETIVLEEAMLRTVARKIRAAAFVDGGVSVGGLFAELAHKIFEEVDSRQDGELNWNEFRSGMRRVTKVAKKTVSDDELAAVFLYIDKDTNGTVDVHEFIHFVEDMSADVEWSHGIKMSPARSKVRTLRHPPRPAAFISEAHAVAWRITAALDRRSIPPEDFFHRAGALVWCCAGQPSALSSPCSDRMTLC